MSLVTKWDGSVQVPANSANERTTKLGNFVAINKITTYYPIPSAYSKLLATAYLYQVPPKYAGRPDLIAKELYQDSALWWVVFWANSIVDPFARPYPNEIIRIINIQDMKNLF